jgi:hypothetical protein
MPHCPTPHTPQGTNAQCTTQPAQENPTTSFHLQNNNNAHQTKHTHPHPHPHPDPIYNLPIHWKINLPFCLSGAHIATTRRLGIAWHGVAWHAYDGRHDQYILTVTWCCAIEPSSPAQRKVHVKQSGKRSKETDGENGEQRTEDGWALRIVSDVSGQPRVQDRVRCK